MGSELTDMRRLENQDHEPRGSVLETPTVQAAFPAGIRARDEVYAKTGAPAVELCASDLPAFCPNPSMPLWASHPRIFLDVVNESEAMCPYCGTRYRLQRNAHVRDHEFDTRNLHQQREQYAVQRVTDPQASAPLIYPREAANVTADALGNTTLEQMTRWLKRVR